MGRSAIAERAVIRPRRTPSLSTEVKRRLTWLTAVLGNNKVAELLGVSRSQPSRWRTGAEGLAARNQRALLDLDYVIVRLHQLWDPEVAAIWIESPNAHLGGATPLDVLRQRGTQDVINAIDAEAQGAYA